VILELDLNPDDYRIKRYISPRVFSVARNRVNQFPIVHISDRDHRKWVNEFVRKISRSQEKDMPERPDDGIPI